jgi:hypothetical protein
MEDLDHILLLVVFRQDSLFLAWVLDRVCELGVVKLLILTALLNGFGESELQNA